ncbi:BCL-6 corepressor-like protein 1 [Carassius carassius]|uniref:BCL-6 corepressor-like protein 1 n=1 Tax=Carassius carassius TaxID=217509 RepID=UPI00286915B2|nr:BCL-6 corepressor-like protein 1 [Carassius carassius]XP_059377674.1 BCL-6 corepressor-like protein 1 [Carassius carassius]XP_059377675.1 BCL-6 corepressor-like protein 1 [Carassius carassius]XP_059377676.1 BCL-6 corepressor-like protein 1 [Carassius carassius]
MQVDPSPMNVGDGGTVSRESGAPTQVSESMVGNPQQTLPLELRGDIPQSQQNKLRVTTDCKTPDVCSEASNSNHCPPVPPSQPLSNVFSTDLMSTLLPDRTEVPKSKTDGAGIYSNHQWPCGKKVTAEDPVNSVHSSINLNRKTNAPALAQPVISVPLGFQCSTLFKPGQPVAFLPPSNISSPLCKITLPPGLGQIAALREATASQFQKDCTARSSCSSATPMIKTYPYNFSMGRGPGADKKPQSSGSKIRCDSLSKGFQGGAEHKATMSSVAAPALALPVQQAKQGSAPPSRYTISPNAAICCSPALANITTQNRLLSLVERGSTYRGPEKTLLTYLKPKILSTPEEHSVTCPVESRDVPLDLSAKSKRQKIIKDAQNTPLVATEHHSAESHQKNVAGSKKVHSGSSSTYDTQRNGATQKSSSKLTNHHTLEPNTSWAKGSSPSSLNNLPGTYVGVASPILASTLRSKDGKSAAFVEDLQTFAKQETISIIDQGEQPVCRERQVPFAVKGAQHNKGGKLSTGTQQSVLSSQLCATSNSQLHQKSVGGKGGSLFTPPFKSMWQPPCVLSQGTFLQKRPSLTQAPKTKSTLSCESALFHNSHLSPTKVVDEKWEKAKSPLSNLESIVKQKTLETTALTGENYCNLSSVGSKKPEVASMQNRCQESTLQQTLTTCSSQFRAIEGQAIKSDRTSPQTDLAALSRPEITVISVPKDKGREKQAKQTENLASDGRQKIKSGTPSKRSAPSVKGEWKERKLAQKIEDEMAKEEKASERKFSTHVKVEGIALSLLQSQTKEAEGEAKMNGAKEEIPSKGKVSATKQKNLKKTAKEKTPYEVQKKPMKVTKKQKDKDSQSVKQGPVHKKKKDALPGVGNSVLKETSSAPKVGGKTRKGKNCPANMEHSDSNKIVTDLDNSPCKSSQVDRDSGSLSSPSWPSKESDSQEEASPRLRRGRRRTDEALLRDWSFATPPTPPPLDPPSTPPPVPVRRPRGRPRINPLPEDVDADKDRPTESGDTSAIKKRKRCKNRKYQNGEYITEKEKVADGEEEKLDVEDSEATNEKMGVYPCLSATLTGGVSSSDISPRRTLFTRSGSARPQESPPTAQPNDKPSGKRKFKSKHLSDTDDQKKLKTKKGSLGKRTGPLMSGEDGPVAKKTPTTPYAFPKQQSNSPLSGKKGTAGKSGIPESTPSRPVPPEVRRLIVNKNAGETLLQRAARLGYQDVVLYCLEKDVREVNRRDNAGYTALHEACARGWTHIIQVLLKHGADVNCSAQDGTRPIHDAVAADNLAAVWMLLNHGADPTLATYSGQTAIKLAQSPGMKTFLKEYFTDLEGRTEQDPSLQWDFYSSSVFETEQEPCWDFLLSQPEEESGDNFSEQLKERDTDTDCLLFEFSSDPLLPCYHVQVSLTQGFCNWFLLADVLKRLKMSARIFRARYPQFEVVSIAQAELWKQVSVSQTCIAPDELQLDDEDREETVELVRCVPELQGLLGSSIQIVRKDEDDKSGPNARPCSR